MSTSALEAILRHDRAIIIASLAVLTALAPLALLIAWRQADVSLAIRPLAIVEAAAIGLAGMVLTCMTIMPISA